MLLFFGEAFLIFKNAVSLLDNRDLNDSILALQNLNLFLINNSQACFKVIDLYEEVDNLHMFNS